MRTAALKPALLCLAAMSLCGAASAQTIISVFNVDDLYTAVNDTNNAGATVLLAPGVYMLSTTDSNGAPRPNGGRLEFQRDMSLIGVEGDRQAVVISAINLPSSSFPTKVNGVATGPNAAVRMGLGHNSLQWLTVRDAANGQANIDTGLQPRDPADTYVLIAHIATTGSTRGLNILNFGPQSSGQTIEAELDDDYFFGNVFNQGEGLRIGNFQGATGSTVNVQMSGNVSWGNKQGRFLVNNSAVNSTVNVFAAGNQFSENGAGTIVIGGLAQGSGRADGNTINLEAHGDQFLKNTAQTEFDRGGLVVLGTEDVVSGGTGGSNNTVNVNLYGAKLADNFPSTTGLPAFDLYAVGARSLTAADASLNQNNQVTIQLHGPDQGPWDFTSLTANTVAVSGLPPSSDSGNSASLTRN